MPVTILGGFRAALVLAVGIVAIPGNATTCSDSLSVFPVDAVIDPNGGLVIEGVGTWERTVAHLPLTTVHFVSETERIQAVARIINFVPGRFAQVVVTAAHPLRAGGKYRLFIAPPQCLPKAKAGFLPKPNSVEDLVVTAKPQEVRNEAVTLSLDHTEGCAAPKCRSRGAVFTSGSTDAGRLLFVSLEEKSTGDTRRMFLEEEEGKIELYEGMCLSGAHWNFQYKGEVCVRASSASPSVEGPKLGAPKCFTLPEEKADGGR